MSGKGFTIDFKDFNKSFKKMAEKEAPSQVAKGLFQAGNEALSDAINKVPKAPKDIGDLRGSAKVMKAEVKGKDIDLTLGFDIEYAARWHELSPAEDSRINWTLPGSGAKYLSSKLQMYKNKYMSIVADVLGKVLR
jgi:hypothetical protein